MTLFEGGSEEKHDDNFTKISESNSQMDDLDEEIKKQEALELYEEKVISLHIRIVTLVFSIFNACIL